MFHPCSITWAAIDTEKLLLGFALNSQGWHKSMYVINKYVHNSYDWVCNKVLASNQIKFKCEKKLQSFEGEVMY
jgi:hypothetical protein